MLPALVVGTCHSNSVKSALGPFVAKPCTNTVYVSPGGLFTLTISFESPSGGLTHEDRVRPRALAEQEHVEVRARRGDEALVDAGAEQALPGQHGKGLRERPGRVVRIERLVRLLRDVGVRLDPGD